MPFINIFKKPKPEKKKGPVRKGVPKLKEAASERAAKKEEIAGAPAEKKSVERKEAISSTAWQVLKHPHVTEKAADLAEQSQYVFRVLPRANKPAVKKAVQDLYGVEVISVHIISIPPKKRRRGRIEGWRKGYKKAIVRLREGQKIEILPR